MALLKASTLLLSLTALVHSSHAWASPVTAESQQASPTFLTVNGIDTPVDVEGTPHFGWHVAGASQTAYQIMISSTAAKAAAGDVDVWDSVTTSPIV